ncbi:MAG TPA: hypothetical protein VI461_01035 [Chitinophagaceae bacterium]|nr:hypothetical protein [Chitinophagaceae bacterium]
MNTAGKSAAQEALNQWLGAGNKIKKPTIKSSILQAKSLIFAAPNPDSYREKPSG